jgi:beta-lactamase class D
LKDAMLQAPGTVENARGVHKLDATWSPGIKLNSKTGATTIESGESISWLVGQLTVDKRELTFASATGDRKAASIHSMPPASRSRRLSNRGVLSKPAR